MNELTHSLLADASNGVRIGETLFAAARTALEQKNAVSPLEVFLTGVVHEGVRVVPEIEAIIGGATVTLHNVEVDLAQIGKSLLTFSADSSTATPLTAPAAPTTDATAPAEPTAPTA